VTVYIKVMLTVYQRKSPKIFLSRCMVILDRLSKSKFLECDVEMDVRCHNIVLFLGHEIVVYFLGNIFGMLKDSDISTRIWNLQT
jgi:hypothetical protein